jgi:hypothetical protein
VGWGEGREAGIGAGAGSGGRMGGREPVAGRAKLSADAPCAPCPLQLYNEDINDLLAPENQKLAVRVAAPSVPPAGPPQYWLRPPMYLLPVLPAASACTSCSSAPCEPSTGVPNSVVPLPFAQVHETKEAGVYVAGLREDIVSSAEQVGGSSVELEVWAGAGRRPRLQWHVAASTRPPFPNRSAFLPSPLSSACGFVITAPLPSPPDRCWSCWRAASGTATLARRA